VGLDGSSRCPRRGPVVYCYSAVTPCLSAYLTSSAVDPRPTVCIISYLCVSTVRVESPRIAARSSQHRGTRAALARQRADRNRRRARYYDAGGPSGDAAGPTYRGGSLKRLFSFAFFGVTPGEALRPSLERSVVEVSNDRMDELPNI
jgi:hypothetical protein